MILHIYRTFYDKNVTLGELYHGDSFLCHTLEPPLMRSRYPAVPEDIIYPILLNYPSKMGLRPLLKNVPGRAGILIHEGNTVLNTHGCILVGNRTVLPNGTVALQNSKKTLDHLIQYICLHKDTDEGVSIIIKRSV